MGRLNRTSENLLSNATFCLCFHVHIAYNDWYLLHKFEQKVTESKEFLNISSRIFAPYF